MKTLNQQWANKILEQVEKVPKDKTYRQKYGSMSHKLPVLVRTAGLVQALSFVEARGESAHHQLLTDLATILGHENDKDALLTRVYKANLDEYMYLTQRVLAALLWYKRFAQSVLGVEAGTEDTGSPGEGTADASTT